jgi:hypothetical protein
VTAVAKGATAEAPADDGLARISELPGAWLSLERCRWEIDQQAANGLLVALLGELAGSRERSGIEGFSRTGSPETWRKLADLDPALVEGVVSRVRRMRPELRIEDGGATDIREALDNHFTAAQRRRALL